MLRFSAKPRQAASIALLLAACSLQTATALAATPPAPASAASASDADAWQVVGRQGIIQVVIVPESQMHDKDAYLAQINRLCEPGQTCFINFFTNSTQAAAGLPLPDAISHEATALFRRSVKQGAEMFEWSCRMKSMDDLCF